MEECEGHPLRWERRADDPILEYITKDFFGHIARQSGYRLLLGTALTPDLPLPNGASVAKFKAFYGLCRRTNERKNERMNGRTKERTKERVCCLANRRSRLQDS